MPLHRLFLLALSALPAIGEPVFKLYDCEGNRRAGCLALFSGPQVPYFSPNDNVGIDASHHIIVNGYDLGLSGYRAPAFGEPSFHAVFHDGPYVYGWRFCCDGDGDGIVVRWLLADDLTPEYEIVGFSGWENWPMDVNSKGQFVGGNSYPAYYGAVGLNAIQSAFAVNWLNLWDLVENPERLQYIFALDHFDTQLFRINDDGQALGYTWATRGSRPDSHSCPTANRTTTEGAGLFRFMAFSCCPQSVRPSPSPNPAPFSLLA